MSPSILRAGLWLALLLPACGGRSMHSAQATLGVEAPDVQLTWLDGSPAGSLHDLRGRVVLLEFWRTW